MKALLFLVLSFLIVLPLAAQSIWNGAGTDDNWSTAANWGGTAPTQNSNLQFGGTTRLSNLNNLTAGTNFNSITFNSGAGAFNLTGNNIYLSGNITNSSASLQTVDLAMTLTHHRDFIGGSGGLVLSQPISQTAAYNVGIGAGAVYLTGAASLPDTATLFMIGSSSVVDLSGISAASETVAALNGASGGSVLLGNKTLISGGGTTFAGSMSGTGGSFTKVGTNLLTLSGASLTHTGTTAVNQGSIRLRNASITGGAITVASGARLYVSGNESGTIGGTVTVNAGGLLEVSGTPGRLNLAAGTVITNNGGMTMTAGGLVYTRMHLYGDASLGGNGTLTLSDSAYNLITGESGAETLTHGVGHTIQGSGRIGFDALSVINHGTIISNSTSNLRIDPNASGFTNSTTGVLRAVSGSTLTLENGSFSNNGLIESAGTTEFKGAAVNNAGGTIRATAGTLLITSSALTGGSVELSGTAGLTLSSGFGASGPYTGGTLSGGTLTHGGTGMIQTNGNGTVPNNIDSAVSLTASNTIEAGRPLNFTGGISKSGVTTTFSGSATITISSVGISGVAADSHLVTNATSLVLTAPSTYNGGTTISGGTFTLSGAGSLPDTSAVSLTTSGAALSLSGITATSETIGSLAGVAGSSVVLTGKTLVVGGDDSSTTFAGVISGTGASLTKVGTGSLTLSGTNTYTGSTTVNAGTLALGINNALAAGTVSVDGSTATLSLGNFSDTVGGFTLANGARLSTTGGTLTSSTTFDLRSGTIEGGLVGTVGMQKSTAGTVTLSGASTYSGNTQVQTGTLTVTNGSGSATGSGNVTIQAGATLAGTGSVEPGAGKFIYMNGALVVGDPALATPVASSLSLATSGGGSVLLGLGSTLALDLFMTSGDYISQSAAADRIRLFGTLDPGAASTVILGNPNLLTFNYGDRYTIFEVSGPSSILADLNFDSSALGLAPGLFTSFDRQFGILSIVPEPSRLALVILGIGLLLKRRARNLKL